MAVTPTPDNPNGWGDNRNLLDEFKYSPNLILRPGDSIRVKEGPFFERQDGTTTSMAFRGNAVIESIEDPPDDKVQVPGVVLHIQEVTRGGVRWAFHACRITGPTRKADGIMTSRPFKVTKARKPHVVHDVPFPRAV
tara:strand:- start:486 stop:896 length:411 start_codon:yes stop_codon:yes gene_type:complete